MMLSTLTAISPVDGRYRNKSTCLAAYFSEYALIKYRVRVEIEYFIFLAQYIPQIDGSLIKKAEGQLRNIYLSFSEQDATRIKEIESTTNHDVKAVDISLKKNSTQADWKIIRNSFISD
jgi:adenylosuccinate lyase